MRLIDESGVCGDASALFGQAKFAELYSMQ